MTGENLQQFLDLTCEEATQLALLDQAYSALKESVYDALLPQTRLKPYLDDIGLMLDGNPLLGSGQATFNFDGLYWEVANNAMCEGAA